MTVYPLAAQPLDEAAQQELRDEGLGGQLVTIEGLVYDDNDLFACDSCDGRYVDPAAIFEGQCEDCRRQTHKPAKFSRRYLDD